MDFSFSWNPFWEKAIPCLLNFLQKDLQTAFQSFYGRGCLFTRLLIGCIAGQLLHEKGGQTEMCVKEQTEN